MYLDMPPPICPSLVMPNMEARFLMNMEELLLVRPGRQQNPILGMSGRQLLIMTVETSEGNGFKFQLSSIGIDEPRVTIIVPHTPPPTIDPSSWSNFQDTFINVPPMTVYARGMRLYGTMEMVDSSVCDLRIGSQTVLHLNTTDQHEQSGVAVYAASGLPLATMHSLTPEQAVAASVKESARIWVVKPSVDAVLITACMLALLLRLEHQFGASVRRCGQSRLGGAQDISV